MPRWGNISLSSGLIEYEGRHKQSATDRQCSHQYQKFGFRHTFIALALCVRRAGHPSQDEQHGAARRRLNAVVKQHG